MANARSKNTRSVPSKKAGRHRPPAVDPNPSKHQSRKPEMVVNPHGKKRMV